MPGAASATQAQEPLRIVWIKPTNGVLASGNGPVFVNGLIADVFDGMKVILNHMTVAAGVELDPDEQAALFTEWRRNLFEIARRPNVFCKIGGPGMLMWGFGFHDRQEAVGYRELAEVWRPFAETAIEAFGPERCMMESNFPPDSLSCGFVPCWNAVKHIVSAYSSDDKAALFNRTASQVYRM